LTTAIVVADQPSLEGVPSVGIDDEAAPKDHVLG
jgi:hypothetical protein